jgi:hypothetical protein
MAWLRRPAMALAASGFGMMVGAMLIDGWSHRLASGLMSGAGTATLLAAVAVFRGWPGRSDG